MTIDLRNYENSSDQERRSSVVEAALELLIAETDQSGPLSNKLSSENQVKKYADWIEDALKPNQAE